MRASLIEGSPSSKLPELDELTYLSQVFDDLGMYKPGANGPEVLPYTEIQAYCDLTGFSLSPAEVMMVRNMSREYVNQYYAGEDPGAPAPYTEVSVGEVEGGTDSNILQAFRRRAEGNKR